MTAITASTPCTESGRGRYHRVTTQADGIAPGAGMETASAYTSTAARRRRTSGYRAFVAMIALVFAAIAAVPAGYALEEDDCADIPAFCRWDVRRAEEAYREGLRLADTEEAKDEARRVRVASLAFIVDTTFESVLAWLSTREDLARALEDDQAMWLRGMTALPDENQDDLDRIAATLKNRLRVFGTITGDNFCPDPGGC